MKYLLTGAAVFVRDKFIKADILVSDGRIVDISPDIRCGGAISFDFNNRFVFPGLVDVHVHLREPGFIYKESVKTGTRAAARGGFTAVCAMPNLNPVPDCLENLSRELDSIKKDAAVRVYPYGSITKGENGIELSDMDALALYVCGFSDDGKGVLDDSLMHAAMIKAKSLGKIIAAHCEDTRFPDAESEYRQLERDIKLAAQTGCAYHACHISCAQSVDLVRKAKTAGLDVTAETAPHYLTLCNADIKDDGSYKMNPPIKSPHDREALLEGICDGTIEIIATDHAPHSPEEKSKGFAGSVNGITGLEASFPVMYTSLVKSGLITLEKLLALMSVSPAKRFGIEPDGLAVFDLNTPYKIDPNSFISKGKSTPFAGMEVYGKCVMTLVGGETAWKETI